MVCLVNRIWAVSCGLQILAGVTDSFSKSVQNGPGANIVSHSMCNDVAFSDVKRMEREANHSSPCTVEAKNQWRFPPLCIYDFPGK